MKPAERILGLSDAVSMYAVFRIKDPRGAVVANAPFWIDVYAPEGQSSSYQHSFKTTTDGAGLIIADIPSSEFTTRKVSITPLLPYPDGPVNQAIVWQIPFLFTADKSNVVDIVLKPGGGLSDKPAPSLVFLPPTLPSGPSSGSSQPLLEESSGINWILVLSGLGAFVAAYFLIPIALDYWKKKGVSNG